MRLAQARRMPQLEQLATQLDRLADFEACPFPVISLYLNLQADEHGKNRFEPFLRKELPDRIRTYGISSPERHSLEQDAEKIQKYVDSIDSMCRTSRTSTRSRRSSTSTRATWRCSPIRTRRGSSSSR